jgi:hypothetical protein
VALLQSSLLTKLPSNQITVSTPALHPAQREIERGSKRFNVLCCGRRFGKDIYLERKVARTLLKSKLPVGWFAPSYRMLLENWRMMRNVLAPVTIRANESEHRLDLVTGNPLEMWSLENQDAARGRKYGHVVINEAAMVRGLLDAWNMVIRPTLADYRGGADIASTPRGLNGFYDLWRLAGEGGDWARFHYRTEDNPYIPRDEIAAMRATMPARVIQQEIDAEFVEDGAFFQGVNEAAVVTEYDMPEQHTGHYIVGGLDWALSEDFTSLTIACRDCKRVIYWDRFNHMDYTYQRQKVYDACKKYNVSALLPERNSIGQPNIEMLMQMRLAIATGPDGAPGFNTSATTKPQLILKLANALEHDGLKVPVEYADELLSYQVEVSATNPKFSAPEGKHDDRVISLALCWWAMTMYSRFGGIHA